MPAICSPWQGRCREPGAWQREPPLCAPGLLGRYGVARGCLAVCSGHVAAAGQTLAPNERSKEVKGEEGHTPGLAAVQQVPGKCPSRDLSLNVPFGLVLSVFGPQFPYMKCR